MVHHTPRDLASGGLAARAGSPILWMLLALTLAPLPALGDAAPHTGLTTSQEGELLRFLRAPALDDRPPPGLLGPVHEHYLRPPRFTALERTDLLEPGRVPRLSLTVEGLPTRAIQARVLLTPPPAIRAPRPGEILELERVEVAEEAGRHADFRSRAGREPRSRARRWLLELDSALGRSARLRAGGDAHDVLLLAPGSRFRVESVSHVPTVMTGRALTHVRLSSTVSIAATFRARFARQRPVRILPSRDLRRYFDSTLTQGSRHIAVRSDGAFPERAVLETLAWVVENSGTLRAGSQLLRTLHARLNAGNRFLWYHARRVKDAVASGRLSVNGGLVALRRVATGNSRLSRPLGDWRSPRWDQFRQDGFQKSGAGVWYFTRPQFAALSANPYFTLEAPAAGLGEHLQARFWYLDAARIEEAVTDAFAAFHDQIPRARDDLERIRTVFRLRMCLISIHPFADGNGRTVQALIDALLLSAGLPPPLEMLEDDFERPFESSFGRFVESMDAWLRMGEGPDARAPARATSPPPGRSEVQRPGASAGASRRPAEPAPRLFRCEQP